MDSTNYRKHTSTNPLQQLMIRRFYRVLEAFVRETGADSVLDAGCGEGFTLHRLKQSGIGKRYAGIDASRNALAVGSRLHPGFSLRQGNIYALPFPDKSFDLVLCNEVLEHLSDPVRALRELSRTTKTWVLVSVPWEPWFRLANFLRGKYLRTWGNHPEHIQHWTKHSFLSFLRKNGCTIVHAGISFPWIIVLARRRDRK